MKFIILAAIAFLILGWHLASPRQALDTPQSVSDDERSSPFSSIKEPAEVFQKAFWKRPTADDTILHAERREWKTNTGVSKWQWYISVRPSPVLVEYLIQGNAFMLVKMDEPELPALEAKPEWFPESMDGYQVLANASRSYRLLWDPKANLLHATDSGGGFQPGAPEPARELPISSGMPGRLPLTPPPDPRHELSKP